MTKEVNHRNGSKSGEEISAVHSRSSKAALLKADKSGNIENVKINSKIVALPPKRKGAAPGSRKKRLRMENKDSIELKLTWEEAQELLHPPLNHKPSIVIIEGHEFEEYEVRNDLSCTFCLIKLHYVNFFYVNPVISMILHALYLILFLCMVKLL